MRDLGIPIAVSLRHVNGFMRTPEAGFRTVPRSLGLRVVETSGKNTRAGPFRQYPGAADRGRQKVAKEARAPGAASARLWHKYF